MTGLDFVPFLKHPQTGQPWLIVVVLAPHAGDRVGLLRSKVPQVPSGQVIAVDQRHRQVTVLHDDGGRKVYPAARLWREDA